MPTADAASPSSDADASIEVHRLGEDPDRIAAHWTPRRIRSARSLDPGVSEPGLEPRSHPLPYSRSEVSDNRAFPNRTHGRVLFQMPGFGTGACSATVVESPNRAVLLTAGHCLHGGPPGGTTPGAGPASSLMFVPAYRNRAEPFGRYAATHMLVAAEWSRDENYNYDFGAAVLARESNGRLVEDVVGSRPIAFNQPRDAIYEAFGYPANDPFDGERMYACESRYGGDDPFTAGSSGPPGMAIGCDMSVGASGGGWVAGGAVRSVSSHGAADHPGVIYGPYLGDVAQALYGQAGAVETGSERRCAGRRVSHLGTGSDDTLRGTRRRDSIQARGSKDIVTARRGRDVACGGSGRDALLGGRGKDKLKGGRARDVLVGGRGADVLVGGAGRDVCVGGAGRDKLRRCERTERR